MRAIAATSSTVLGWLGEEDVAAPAEFRNEISGLSVPESETLAREVTRFIHQYCRRTLRQRDIEERFFLSASLGPRLYLSGYPIVSVTSVTIDGEATTDFLVEQDKGVLVRTRDDNGTTAIISWTGRNIVVTYRAGYLYATETPADLKRAALSLGAFLHESRGRDFSLRSMNIQGVGSVSWLDPQNGGGMIPETIRNVLDFYRDMVP